MIVIALHVLVAFAAIAFLVVPGWMLVVAARSNDVAFIRRTFALGAFHGRMGGPLALLAGLLGFGAAAAAGVPLNAGWLVASYVVYAAAMIVGIAYHMRWEIRVFRLAQASAAVASVSERNFRRLGFEVLYTRTVWERPLP